MDRGAWQATVHGVVRVRYDLATKPMQHCNNYTSIKNKLKKNKRGSSQVAHMVKNLSAVQMFDSWVGKMRWRRDRLPTRVFLGFLGD